MDNYFQPGLQPSLDAILANLNVLRIDQFACRRLGGAAIQACEMYTNVNALIGYISLGFTLYNLEGANRVVTLLVTGGGVLFTSGTVANTTSYSSMASYNNTIFFNSLTWNVAPINAGTTFSFIGFRVTMF